MRSMWKGTVSFGLVSIPIHLYTATESKSISFRQVHAADGGRIHYKRICSVDGKEVPYPEIAKGYEVDDETMVILTDDDLANVPISSSRSIDVLEFLPLEAIDPISYDRSYYIEPQKAAIKPYVLLRDSLQKSGRVALVKVTLRQRESLAILRVYADVLVMSTLLWPEEVRTPAFGFLKEETQVRDQELKMASSLIDSMTEEVFDPNAFEDSYQQALRELIDAKIEGKDTATLEKDDDGKAEVIDLMSALQASINANKKSRDTGQSEESSEDSADDDSSGGSDTKKTARKSTSAKKTGPSRTSSTSKSKSGQRSAASGGKKIADSNKGTGQTRRRKTA